jgi:hypothetical protein
MFGDGIFDNLAPECGANFVTMGITGTPFSEETCPLPSCCSLRVERSVITGPTMNPRLSVTQQRREGALLENTMAVKKSYA